MNKMIDFAKRYKLYLLSFFLITLIFVTICIIKGIIPFGENTFLYSDFIFQEHPMLIDLSNAIKNNSLIYDWNGGFGAPLYRVFFNYMSSPVNLIILLFNIKDVHAACTLILYFKFIITGFTMTYYLKHHFDTNNILLLIPTLLYTFCGYAVAFFFNIKWTDFLFILPILTWSIERLIKDHKTYLFIFTLFFAIFDNFYIAYMICYYVAIYFLFYNLCFVKGKSIKDKLNKMSTNFMIILGSTVLAMLLSSVILLPNYYASTTFNAIGGGFPTERYYDFTYIDFIVGHLPGSSSSLFLSDNTNNPNVYVGLLSFVLFIPFVFNKDIKLRNKIFYLLILITYLLIFRIPMLDFFVNVFHVPNDLPYRYSFCYSFILTVLLTEQLLNLKNKKTIIFSSLLTLGLLIFLIFKPINIDDGFAYINIALLIFYVPLLIIDKPITKYLLILIVVIELILNANNNLNDIKYDNVMFDSNKYELIDKYNDSYYRMEGSINQYRDDPYKYNYKSTSISTSTLYGLLCQFIIRFGGVSDGSTNIYYHYTNPVYDTLFNMKYIYDNDYSSKYYDYNGEIYEYKYPLSLAYGVNKNDGKIIDIISVELENKIINDFTGIDNIYEELTPKKKVIQEDDEIIAIEYEVNSDDILMNYNDVTLYYYFIDKELYTPYVSDDFIIKEYNRHTIIGINNYFDHMDKVTVVYNKNIFKEDVLFYKLNKDKFDEMYNYLSKYQANINTMDTYGVKGNITLDKNMEVFASIPYDKGWHVYVDGKEVEVKPIYEAFITFDMDEGYHEFELRYEIPYLNKSFIISVSTFIGMMVYYIYRRIKHGKS